MIREATVSDINSIIEIITKTWEKAISANKNYQNILNELKYNENKYIKNLTKGINFNLIKVFVYEENKKITGFISGKLKLGEYDSEIIEFYVDPDFHDKGIGSKLFNGMVSYFKKNNRKKLILWAFDTPKINDFYKKHGGIGKKYKEINPVNKNYNEMGFCFNIEGLGH